MQVASSFSENQVFPDPVGSLPSKIYILHEKPPVFYPTNLFKDISSHQAARLRKSKDLAKILLKERISGRSIADSAPESSYYLEYNARTMGVFVSDEYKRDFRYQENLINVCCKSGIWLQGQVSENFYIKKIDCRKSWCPVCGGKGGKIHNSRLHAILTRADFNKYNLRQLVFTVPEGLRDFLSDRENLSKAIKSLKSVIEKFFGVPQFDKKGWIKHYDLKKGVVFYFHAFGDEAPGVYKPHFNIQVFENKSVKLKLGAAELELIKKLWLKELKKFDKNIDVVDVHYSFRNNVKKNVHSIKYMCKPWSAVDYAAIDDLDLKKFLVSEMSGFQYVRFWGSMANCKYRDEMTVPAQVEEVENKAGEKLVPLFIAPFDYNSWAEKLEQIDDGFYRVKRNKDCIKYIDEKLKNEKLLKSVFEVKFLC